MIDFPKLGHSEKYTINQNQLSFDEARNYKEFKILGRQRVVNFLKAAYAAFDSSGVWKDESIIEVVGNKSEVVSSKFLFFKFFDSRN